MKRAPAWKPTRRSAGGRQVYELTIPGKGVVGETVQDNVSRMWKCYAQDPDGTTLATWFSRKAKREVAKEIERVFDVARAVAFLSDESVTRAGMAKCLDPIGPKWDTPCGRCRPCLAKKESERRYRRKFGGGR